MFLVAGIINFPFGTLMLPIQNGKIMLPTASETRKYLAPQRLRLCHQRLSGDYSGIIRQRFH